MSLATLIPSAAAAVAADPAVLTVADRFDGPGWGFHPAFAIVGFVVRLLVFAALVFAVVMLARRWRAAAPWGRRGADPERLLAERYATGEVTEAEYRERLDVLRATRPQRR